MILRRFGQAALWAAVGVAWTLNAVRVAVTVGIGVIAWVAGGFLVGFILWLAVRGIF